MNYLKPSLTLLTLGAALPFGTSMAQEKPNVLFIMVDDLQSFSIAQRGNPDVTTPNIDSIIRSGTYFNNTYSNGALGGALSMPSRAMVMTGKNIFEVKEDGSYIPEAHKTMPELFGGQGYRTFATGKWHNDRKSFHRSFKEGDNIFYGGMHQYGKGQGHPNPVLHHYDNTRFVGKEFSSKMFADAAIKFLESTQSQNEPFFAYVSFTSPHDPRNAHPDYVKRMNAQDITLPENFLAEHPFDNGELQIRDELVVPAPRTQEVMKEDLADYYAMVDEVDIQIGRILDELRKTGKEQNTIIVFASDNGLAMGRHGLIGKQSLYDHSMGVPMAIVVPGEKPQDSEALCYLSDIAPTLCELADIDMSSAQMSAKSLAPVIKGKSKDSHHESLLLIYSGIQRAVVTDRYKLIKYNVAGKQTSQLFDLKKDPLEMNNLIDVKKYQKKLIPALNAELDEQMKQQNDFCDLADPTWWGENRIIQWREALKIVTQMQEQQITK